jgi:hypothetical protein
MQNFASLFGGMMGRSRYSPAPAPRPIPSTTGTAIGGLLGAGRQAAPRSPIQTIAGRLGGSGGGLLGGGLGPILRRMR